jgi:hypothetical protein
MFLFGLVVDFSLYKDSPFFRFSVIVMGIFTRWSLHGGSKGDRQRERQNELERGDTPSTAATNCPRHPIIITIYLFIYLLKQFVPQRGYIWHSGVFFPFTSRIAPGDYIWFFFNIPPINKNSPAFWNMNSTEMCSHLSEITRIYISSLFMDYQWCNRPCKTAPVTKRYRDRNGWKL